MALNGTVMRWGGGMGRGLEGGLMTQVSQESHCPARETHRSHHTPAPLPSTFMPYSSCVNSKALAWSSAVTSTCTTHFLFFSLKTQASFLICLNHHVFLCPNLTGERNFFFKLSLFLTFYHTKILTTEQTNKSKINSFEINVKGPNLFRLSLSL